MSNNTPTEHDETWLKLAREVAKLAQVLNYKANRLMDDVGFNRYYRTGEYYTDRNFSWSSRVNVTDAVKIAEEDPTRKPQPYSQSTIGESLAVYIDARDAARDAQIKVNEHEKNYTGWSRYFLVTSSAGLIHKSTGCSTCNRGRKFTEFALLPKLSGLGYETAVWALGPSLCSVCYPDAPTEVVDGPKIPNRITSILLSEGEAAFEAELAKYNAKRAAKAAK